MKFAVVDIETTGLYHQGHGITEVAVVHIDDGKPRLAFHSLINPQRDIPTNITYLTGINATHTEEAPFFGEIIEKFLGALENRIFVAHNVNFDFQFLKAACQSESRKFNPKKLCTMRYARKLRPGLQSYRLGKLCEEFEIVNSETHRAGGDALATAELLCKLFELDRESSVLDKLLKRKEHVSVLPPGLDEREVVNLPEQPGVYYLFGEGVKPIYIGKAKNLKKRVLSHFTSSGSSRRKQLFQREVRKVEYKLTGSEYHALLLEDAEIKKWWPRYNLAQKDQVRTFGIVPYTDRSGKQRLAIVKSADRSDAISWFNSIQAAKNWLYRSFLDFGVDPRRAGLPLTEDFDTFDESRESEGFEEFLSYCRNQETQSYALLETQTACRRYALVLQGRYKGFGRLDSESPIEKSVLESNLQSAPDSTVARAVVRNMLADQRIEILNL